MAKLSMATKTRRIAEVLDVLMLTIGGNITVEAACQEVGIAPNTYWEWVKRGEDTIETFRELIAEQQRLQLFQITAARMKNVSEITKSIQEPMTMKDRVLADKVLSSYGNELEKNLHAQPGYEEEASRFLSEGPKLRKQQSRLASMEISHSESGIRVDVYKDTEIIDAESEPLESDD